MTTKRTYSTDQKKAINDARRACRVTDRAQAKLRAALERERAAIRAACEVVGNILAISEELPRSRQTINEVAKGRK